jgi:hypothetical protein
MASDKRACVGLVDNLEGSWYFSTLLILVTFCVVLLSQFRKGGVFLAYKTGLFGLVDLGVAASPADWFASPFDGTTIPFTYLAQQNHGME